MNRLSGRILVIDDSVEIHEVFRKLLCSTRTAEEIGRIEEELFGETLLGSSSLRCEVVSAYQGQEGVLRYEQDAGDHPFDVVLVDMRMPPGWDGLRTIKEIWARNADQFVVLCTAYSDHSYESLIRELGNRPNFLVLAKPFQPEEVLQIVNSALLSVSEEERADKTSARDLGKAADRSELSLVYQPINDLRDGSVLSVECLCRWTRGGRTVMGPDEFVKIAEDYGQIHQLGSWVAQAAVSAAAEIQSRFGPSPHPTVFFNVSALQLERGFWKSLVRLCADLGVPPSSIGIEMTESQVMRNTRHIAEILGHMANAGFRIAIDNFGAGLSSLHTLSSVPHHRIKSDRFFLDGLAGDQEAQLVLGSLIDLAEKLGKEFVAGGIETEEQRSILVGLGCRYGQGYLYSHPVPLIEALELLPGESAA